MSHDLMCPAREMSPGSKLVEEYVLCRCDLIAEVREQIALAIEAYGARAAGTRTPAGMVSLAARVAREGGKA